jgi:hypothetical protein
MWRSWLACNFKFHPAFANAFRSALADKDFKFQIYPKSKIKKQIKSISRSFVPPYAELTKDAKMRAK